VNGAELREAVVGGVRDGGLGVDRAAEILGCAQIAGGQPGGRVGPGCVHLVGEDAEQLDEGLVGGAELGAGGGDADMAEQAFGERVRELRQARRWSQAELAAAMTEAGFPWQPVTVTRVERAQRPTRVSELAALSQVFDVKVGALLLGDPQQEPPVLTSEEAAAEVARLRERIDRVARALHVSAEEAPELARPVADSEG
jgi:transcriptional regulator with XRE-family HTH domain